MFIIWIYMRITHTEYGGIKSLTAPYKINLSEQNKTERVEWC